MNRPHILSHYHWNRFPVDSIGSAGRHGLIGSPVADLPVATHLHSKNQCFFNYVFQLPNISRYSYHTLEWRLLQFSDRPAHFRLYFIMKRFTSKRNIFRSFAHGRQVKINTLSLIAVFTECPSLPFTQIRLVAQLIRTLIFLRCPNRSA